MTTTPNTEQEQKARIDEAAFDKAVNKLGFDNPTGRKVYRTIIAEYEAARATPAQPDKVEVVELEAIMCDLCGTKEVSVEVTCHNSDCASYAHAHNAYEGWVDEPKALVRVDAALPPHRDDSGLVWRTLDDFGYEEGEIIGWSQEHGAGHVQWCDESQAFYTVSGSDYVPKDWITHWMPLPKPPAAHAKTRV